jgi:hypothetical protein
MIVDIGMVAVFWLAALAFGSNEPWAMGIIIAATSALLAMKFVYESWREKPFSGSIFQGLQ